MVVRRILDSEDPTSLRHNINRSGLGNTRPAHKSRMPTLVARYGKYGQMLPTSALMAKTFARRYRWGMQAAKFAWKHRAKFAAAAQKLDGYLAGRRAWRREVSKKSYARIKQRLAYKGARVQNGARDRAQKKFVTGTITTLPEDLIFERVDFPGNNGTANNSTRLTQRILVKGILCDDTFYNPNNYDINLHWALLQYKEEEPADWGAEFYKDFFRDVNSAADRSRDYVQGVWNYDNETMGINKDKWNVLTHKRIQLGKDTADSHYVSKASHRDRSYYKINKMFAFEGLDGKVTMPLYIATWWQPVIKENTSQFDDTISHYRNRVVYYGNLV